jgi:hypothetical protein
MAKGAGALLLAVALLGCSRESPGPDPAVGFNPTFSDALVAERSQLVLDLMPRLQCGETPCAAATEEERRSGMIPMEDARAVFRQGLLSQLRECAGRDWEREGFLPLMYNWRHVRKAPVRQLAFVGALHGSGMSAALQSMGGSCPKNS